MAKRADDMIKRHSRLGMGCPDMGDGKRLMIQGIKPESRGVEDELKGWPGIVIQEMKLKRRQRTQRTADRSQW